MKLLIAAGLYPPDIGGPAVYTALIEEELPKQGIAVKVLPFRSVRHLPFGLRHLVYFWKCLCSAVGQDAIYAQDPVSVGLPAALVSILTGRRFLIRIAGDYAWEQSVQRFGVNDSIDDFQNRHYGWRTEFLRRLQRWVVNQAETVITPSLYFQKLVQGWVRQPAKVITIYNGIRNKHIKPKNLGKRRPIILSAGRLVPWKGFGTLIELMRELPGWRLVIVGDGPEQHNLTLKIKNLALEDRVVLAGSVPRESMEQYLSDAAVFVLNTSFESFSFQVVEAMAAGVPVVTTKIGNLKEIIEDGKEGLLVEPNNKKQLAEAIQRFDVYNEDFRLQVIRSALSKAEQFSLEKTVSALSSVLNHRQSFKTFKVLMLSTDQKILTSGSIARQRMLDYAAGFQELHIILYTTSSAGFKATESVGKNVFVYPTNSWQKWTAGWAAYSLSKKLLEQGGPWVITAQDPFETGWIASRLARRFRIPLQLQIHTDFLSQYFSAESLKNKIRVWIAKRIIPGATGLRVVSERIKHSLLREFPGLPDSKIVVLPISVETDIFRRAPVTDLRKKYSGYEYILLLPARLTLEKNIALAIDAMQELQKRGFKCRVLLLIVGEGPEKSKLQLLITNYQLQNNVIIEPWTSDLVFYYQTADALLLTSNYEGGARTPTEAVAAGLPVIMTDVAPANESVKNGLNGFVVPVGDPQALADRIIEFLSDSQKQKEFRQQCLSIAKNFISKDEYTRRYIQSLKDLLSSGT